MNDREIENTTLNIVERQDGHYNSEIFATTLDIPDGTEFTCELRILEANYTVKKAVVYYEVAYSGGTRLFAFLTMIWSCLCMDLFIQARQNI